MGGYAGQSAIDSDQNLFRSARLTGRPFDRVRRGEMKIRHHTQPFFERHA